MICPACKEPLIVVERSGIEVDWCAACGGLWFDQGELALLAASAGRGFTEDFLADAPADLAGDASPRRCPRCPKRMAAKRFPRLPEIRIDACPAGHGFWLDKGELGLLFRSLPGTASGDAGADQAARSIASFLGETFGRETGQAIAPPRADEE